MFWSGESHRFLQSFRTNKEGGPKNTYKGGCYVCCCCPCFACATSRKLGQCLCLPLLDILGCIPAASMALRVSVRHRYGIEGTLCRDCLCATCCPSCVWCQISREMRDRELPAVYGDIITRR